MVAEWLFVWGRDPLLSLAELKITNQQQSPIAKILPHWPEAALVRGSLNPTEYQQRLGGTVKIARFYCQINGLDWDALAACLKSFAFSQMGDKFNYGVSFFGPQSLRTQADFLSFFKTQFKKAGVKAHYKPPRTHGAAPHRSQNPSEIRSRHLLDTGFDFCIAQKDNTFWMGRTVSAANPQALVQRDRQRQRQNPVGAISFRLARILINLSGAHPPQTVLDPFCGVGTILLEAGLLGLNGIGIDKDPSAIKHARHNLQKTSKSSVHMQLLTADATKLHKQTIHFDCVVSEPYLGPFLRKRPTLQQAQRILAELEPLFTSLFRVLSKKMRQGQRIVIVLPHLATAQGTALSFSHHLFEQFGFVSTNPLDAMGWPQAFPYLYKTPYGKIERLIFLLEKTKEKP